MPDTPRLVQPAIRRIRPQDAEAWREVRLRALLDAPEAFGSTHAETIERPSEEWTRRAERSADGSASALFLADDGHEVVGVAGGGEPIDHPEARYLYSMWVAPEWRGRRLGERLVNWVIDWSAERGIRRLDLWVTESNEQARALYTRLTFTPAGRRQPHPSNTALAEIEMTRDLRNHIAVRRIRPDEAEAWRAARLAAVEDAPNAFGKTLAETRGRTLAYWQHRIEDAATGDRFAIFAAIQNGRWVGLAGAETPESQPTVRNLGSIWVAPSARRTSLLPRFLDAVTDWSAAAGATRITLDVAASNARAITIYGRYGFTLTSHRQPLRPDSDLDEVEMAMNLYASEEQ